MHARIRLLYRSRRRAAQVLQGRRSPLVIRPRGRALRAQPAAQADGAGKTPCVPDSHDAPAAQRRERPHRRPRRRPRRRLRSRIGLADQYVSYLGGGLAGFENIEMVGLLTTSPASAPGKAPEPRLERFVSGWTTRRRTPSECAGASTAARPGRQLPPSSSWTSRPPASTPATDRALGDDRGAHRQRQPRC